MKVGKEEIMFMIIDEEKNGENNDVGGNKWLLECLEDLIVDLWF